jgi:hypothetical protein
MADAMASTVAHETASPAATCQASWRKKKVDKDKTCITGHGGNTTASSQQTSRFIGTQDRNIVIRDVFTSAKTQ